MAKPSIANIRSASDTEVWTPPKTEWDLNTSDAQDSYFALNGTPEFDELFGRLVNTGGIDADDYGYIFLGVNGGVNETVIGVDDKAGIIATGNGKDNITGGDLDDLILSGNGMDVVNGGDGSDIIFGENGADQLNGDADDGTANFSEGAETTVTDEDGNPVFVWDEDPNGDITTTLDSGDHTNQLRDEGVFVDGSDIHHVFSFVAGSTGDYTIAFYDGNNVDDGDSPASDSGDDPTPNPIHVTLTGGDKYFFSFEDDDGGQVKVFSGNVTVLDESPPISGVLSNHGYDPESSYTISGGNEVQEFTAGDVLFGGTGPDTFVWDADDANNVDLIWDYNQGSGTYDPLEGDVLVLKNVTEENVTVFHFDLDGDSDDQDDIVIFIGENQAIGLVGIDSIDNVDIQFA